MTKTDRIEITVVPPLPPDEAKVQFKDWVSKHQELVSSLGKTDIVVDIVRGKMGEDLRQYRVFIPRAHQQ